MSLILDTSKIIVLCHLWYWKVINGFTPGDENDTTLMAESKDELKSLLMWVKEESERAGLRLNSKET